MLREESIAYTTEMLFGAMLFYMFSGGKERHGREQNGEKRTWTRNFMIWWRRIR